MMPDRAARRLLGDLAQTSLELTAYEKRVLALMSHGLTRKMAAEELGRSVWIVQDHLDNARIKLGVKTTLHACCKAIRDGIID